VGTNELNACVERNRMAHDAISEEAVD